MTSRGGILRGTNTFVHAGTLARLGGARLARLGGTRLAGGASSISNIELASRKTVAVGFCLDTDHFRVSVSIVFKDSIAFGS